jgi:hypothetical protein
MRQARLALVFVALLIVPASAQVGLSGSWKVEVIRPAGLIPHHAFNLPSALELETDGTKLTGTIRMGLWPGACPIEGIIKGDRFSFTASSHVWSSDGFAKMGFTGTLKGETITLTLESLGYASCPACKDGNEMGNRLRQKIEMAGQRAAN